MLVTVVINSFRFTFLSSSYFYILQSVKSVICEITRQRIVFWLGWGRGTIANPLFDITAASTGWRCERSVLTIQPNAERLRFPCMQLWSQWCIYLGWPNFRRLILNRSKNIINIRVQHQLSELKILHQWIIVAYITHYIILYITKEQYDQSHFTLSILLNMI